MQLKPIKYKKQYEIAIANKITIWLWNVIYKPCFDILKQPIQNSQDIIQDAIINGSIWYENGYFFAKGNFSNAIAKKLEELGAKWQQSKKAYYLAKEKLPMGLIWAIDTNKARVYAKAYAVSEYLLSVINNFDKFIEKLVFNETVNAIMLNLQERVYSNAKKNNIELITPKLDNFMKEEIAKRYTKNLDFWIKDRTKDQIVKMREQVSIMANTGKSVKSIADYIQKEFGIDQRHAKFLARNESAIATTSYLISKYTQEGFRSYKWHSIGDERTRELHRELNGHIFQFDNPPIIDQRTGQRGNPGETYNCRCTFSPIITKEFLENRRKMFKANNSLLGKIKECLKNKRKTI